jgi:hypothetical protein
MRTRIATFAAAAIVMGSMSMAPQAKAAQNPSYPTVPTNPGTPSVHMLDCNGTTGEHGCGPGYIWRNGATGLHCYPCG